MSRVRIGNQPPADELECLRLHQVARLLNISKHTLRAWVARGKFPKPFRVTETLRLWPRAAVAQWIADHEAKARTGRHSSNDVEGQP